MLNEFDFWADQTIHIRLDFWADQTIHIRLTCPLVSLRHGEIVVQTTVTTFLFGSSSNLQIMGSDIKSQTSSILTHFRLLA